jgi:hypothetical protein
VTTFKDITASCAEVSPLTLGALATSQRYIPSTTCTVPISVLESTAYSLVDGDSVYAQMVAYNCHGASVASTVDNGAIIPRVADAPLPRCISQSASTVDIAWDNGVNTGGTPITAYQIIYVERNNALAVSQTITVDAITQNFQFTNRRYTIPGLTNGRQYTIQVASKTAAGLSSYG